VANYHLIEDTRIVVVNKKGMQLFETMSKNNKNSIPFT